MKEILKEWGLFVKKQKERHLSVAERMVLWEKETRLPPLLDSTRIVSYYNALRREEESELNQKFGVVDITFENFLNSLLSKEDEK